MNAPLRALLIFAPVLVIGALVLLSAGSKSKPAVRDERAAGSDGVPAAVEPANPAVSTAQAVAHAPSPSASVAGEGANENSLAAAMHALEDTDPERALEIARRARALWPDGSRAAEFAATEVKCLYRLGMPGEGRGAAEAMVNKYVGSPWALEVERQTGAHPHVDH